MAPAIEDKEEVAEHDDADVNKTHGDEAGDEDKEEWSFCHKCIN